MVISMERYTKFLRRFEQISQAYVLGRELETLKKEYKDVIYSKRVLETIIDISTLLKVLEKRGILQYDDIRVLKHIADQFVRDDSIKNLIVDYDTWLEENSSKINNLYSGGKSINSLDNEKHKAVIAKIEQNCDFLIRNSFETEIEEQCEVLCPIPNGSYELPESAHINVSNTHLRNPFIKFLEKHRKQNFIIFIIISLLLIILIGVFWIMVKLSFQSTAIVSNKDSIRDTPEEYSGKKMPFYMSNVNVGVAMEPRFTVNQTYYHATTTTPMPSTNKEKELQDLIVNKVGRKIGKFWRDASRRLNIEESMIEEIEIKYSQEPQSFEKMFKKATEIYFLEHHKNWKIELMRALELSRRKDLKELVEDIIHQQAS